MSREFTMDHNNPDPDIPRQRLPGLPQPGGPMRIAFTGASGTGKTTMANAVAAYFNLPVCPVGSRSVAQSMGFDNPYDVDKAGKREEFQRRLLLEKIAWERGRDRFVTDRTTLDNMVYSLMHSPDLVSAGYAEAAFQHATLYTTVFITPLDIFQDVGDDPARKDDTDYHREFESLLQEALSTFRHVPGCKRPIPVDVQGKEARRKHVLDYLITEHFMFGEDFLHLKERAR